MSLRLLVPIVVALLGLATASAGTSAAVSEGVIQAQADPLAFSLDGNRVASIDIREVALSVRFDVPGRRAIASARILFTARSSGYPMLLLDQVGAVASLDGGPRSPLRSVRPPGSPIEVQILEKSVAADGGEHVLEVEHAITERDVTYANGGVRVGFFMDDNQGRFLHRYVPANFEYDQFRLVAHLSVAGSTLSHRLFTNGRATQLGASEWNVEFPAYFNSSAHYLHLTSDALVVAEDAFVGRDAAIPITIYSKGQAGNAGALRKIQESMADMESAFGAYPYERFVAYVAPPGGVLSGMEYAGATVGTAASMWHEVAHSWFARGVMPADGNSGWIDEAIASWRDREYPRASSLSPRPPVNLGAFSSFRLSTPSEAYSLGERFMRELDFALAASGGLRPHLGSLFRERMGRVLTTEGFRQFLEQATQANLAPLFERYVYGRAAGGTRSELDELPEEPMPKATDEQLKKLR